ncbi:MAG: prepilin-type N-terminal cleavage/methylation domain-containing protein [FCB group bacterium]|nr:prepilin-type N-terminal cleavage/methylation domain-containing protein [FCB group bacterium]
MNKCKLHKNNGYSLLELVVVIIIIGIITAISIRSLKHSVETAKIEKTKKKLDQLASAIAGNPNLISNSVRTDFGYVGDIGALPTNLNALASNPGYTTWKGPYIHDKFYPNTLAATTNFKYDGWGKTFNYSGSNIISSTGGGFTISKKIANATNDILLNTIRVVVSELNHNPPGSVYKDSILLSLVYPNGAGSYTTANKYPQSDGYIQFDSIPIGKHNLSIIYIPANDTITRKVVVNPGQTNYLELSFFKNYW